MKLFCEAASGGVDIIKGTSYWLMLPSAGWRIELSFILRQKGHAFEETGERTLYTVNITDRADRVRDNAKRSIDAGANALMNNYLMAGISVFQDLAEDSEINLPILAHLDFAGVLYESPFSRISSSLVLGKLPRLSGADIIVYPSPYAKFSFLRDRHLQIAQMLRATFYALAATFPMPRGGTSGVGTALGAGLRGRLDHWSGRSHPWSSYGT